MKFEVTKIQQKQRKKDFSAKLGIKLSKSTCYITELFKITKNNFSDL